MNPESNGFDPPTELRRNRRWLYAAIGLILLIGVAIGLAFLAAYLLGEPPVKSIDEINPAEVEKLAVLAIERPDGKPNISGGGKDPFQIPAAEIASVLNPLRKAKAIQDDRHVYLGYMLIVFRDGRKVKVMLHRFGDSTDPAKPPLLQYRIANYAYEVGPLEPFLKVLDAVEAKAKGRK